MKIFIIHGAFGSPDENWFPWLKTELEKLGHKVIIPRFPTPEDQTLENWMEVFEPYLEEINKETVFIGHSLGPVFILSILEKINVQIRKCIFISGFIGLLGNPDFDHINKTFIDRDFDWEKIKQNCKHFILYHSDNDPYVPIELANDLAIILDSELIIKKRAGHFNKAAGYDKFEELLEKI